MAGYSYDPNGNLTAMTDSTGTTTYTYNSLDQLTQRTLPGGQIVSYTYDSAGNLSEVTPARWTPKTWETDDPRRGGPHAEGEVLVHARVQGGSRPPGQAR
jgi:YD repeat-containing protein